MASKFLTKNYFLICRLHTTLQDWLPCVAVIMMITISEADAPSGFVTLSGVMLHFHPDWALLSWQQHRVLHLKLCRVGPSSHLQNWE